MGNFEKLGILVIIILVVVILVLAVWGMGVPPDEQGDPFGGLRTDTNREAAGATPGREPASNDRVDLADPPPGDAGGGSSARAPWVEDPVDEPSKDDPVKEEPGPTEEDEPAPAREDLGHTVVKNDTLSSLSRKYYGNEKYWKVIRDANPGINPNALQLGASLVIPHPDNVLAKSSSRPAEPETTDRGQRTYTVRKGDTLSTIASRVLGSSTKWKAIYDANRAKIGADPDRLQEGMVLVVP